MEVLDIVQSAAFKAGVVPSFNPDELPEDVLNAGRAALVDEIIPTLNCDRTIDITETSRIYRPAGGKIILKPLRQPQDNTELIGYTDQPAAVFDNSIVNDYIIVLHNYYKAVAKLRPDWVDSDTYNFTDKWPRNEFNILRTAVMWTIDMHAVYIKFTAHDVAEFGKFDANIDFPPMRVNAVMDESSRYTYDYLYRDEYERTFKFTSLPGIYTTEEYDDKLIILLKGSPDPKLVVLPVPLQIINRDYSHSGTIIAPEKFRRYLIDAVAVSLAITYGMSTLPLMEKAAAISYNLLKKNKPQPLHKANVAQEITNKLRPDVLGRRFYANI